MKPFFAAKISAATLAASLALAGCTSAPTTSGGDEGAQTLRISQGAAPSNFQIGNWSGGQSTMYQAIYDRLVRQTLDGEIVGSIAESWKYSDDRLTLTFSLRDGLTFTNSEPVDANAVVASLEVARKGPSSSQPLASIASIEAPDLSTVVVRLNKPDASLLPTLSQVPGAIGAPGTLTAESSKLEPVGSGPYMLDQAKTTAGSIYTLKKNPGFWGAEDYPYEDVEIRIIADATAGLNAVQSGQLDFSGLPSPEAAAQFDKSRFTIGESPATAVLALWFLDREGKVVPQLADVRVRKAISLALDREGIAKAFGPGYKPTNQIFSPAGEVFDEKLLEETPFDPAEARKLLAEAGHPNGFSINMPSVNFQAQFEPAVTQALADIGITVNWETVPFTDFYTKIFGANYGMILSFNGFSGSDASDLNGSTSAVFNPFNLTTPEFTKLASDVNAATEEKQAEGYRALNKYILDEVWAAPFLLPGGQYVTSKSVEFTPAVNYGSIESFKPASTK